MEEVKVLIIGGGTAGLTFAAHLARQISGDDIAIIEPSEAHYYQPLFTLVGAGESALKDTVRTTGDFIPSRVRWIKAAATAIDPEQKTVATAAGVVKYAYLVVCPGLQLNWDKIPGLRTGLGAAGAVCSNYAPEYAEGTWRAIKAFKGGNAIFTFPATPVKCAGAPQKIMYLAEDYFRRHGLRDRANVIYVTPLEKIFAVKKYADALTAIIARRDISILFRHELVGVDNEAQTCTIRDLTSSSDKTMPFALLHVTPPMGPPDFVKASLLANAQGFVDVDRATLQSPRFPNVFSLGDVSSLPTSKTGAAIRAQVPILLANLLAVMAGKTSDQNYTGYTSCPLVTGYGKLILAEFDYDGIPQESFPFDQSKERLSMYLLKKYLLPQLYWRGMLRGRA